VAPLIGGFGDSDVRNRIVRWARALAGPALIVAGPAIVLRGFWLWGRLTAQHVDLLAFWLPRWCHLTGSIWSGHLPTWLPYQFGGVPFLSDPQSGWLNASVFALFSTFSCTRALEAMIVLNPIVAGLGLYLFCRHEKLGRPSATVAGLTLSLTMASSAVALSMPFSGTLAWTAMALAGAAAYLNTRTPGRALAWMGFTAFSLSQVAAAQLTDGLLIAAMALIPYLVARSFLRVRAGEARLVPAVVKGAGLLAVFPLLAAALLIPRLALVPRTSIGHGYVALGRLASQLSGTPFSPPLAKTGDPPWWGTSFARGPAGYVGILALLLIPVALSSRRWRWPAAGFAVVGFIGWFLNLDWLITNPGVRSFAIKFGVGELWLRSPDRFKYQIILVFAALAGYGTQAWLDLRPVSGRRAILVRAAWLVPGVAVFAILPLAAGSRAALYADFLAGLLVGAVLLLFAARGRTWAAATLPVLVALELVTSGVVAPIKPGKESVISPSTGIVERFGRSFFTLRRPEVRPHAYITPGPIGNALIAARDDYGRYLTYDSEISNGKASGFLGFQARKFWPAYENGRSILFQIDEIQGYSPIQLDRYWRLIRRVATSPVFYNAATLQSIRSEVLRLFGVEWLILPTDQVLPVQATAVASEGRYTLYRFDHPEPRASLVFEWQTVLPGTGLDMVLRPPFDPAIQAIVETQPSVGGEPLPQSRSGAGSAVYREVDPEHVRVEVTADSAGLLVVRNAFDRNWHATVDGRPAPVLVTDYLMQGVAVPAGTHTVELTYRDRWIGIGLLVSGTAWAVLLALIAWFVLRDRSGRRKRSAVERSAQRRTEQLRLAQPSPP
jgi:Bacterial membrane protein YfhO